MLYNIEINQFAAVKLGLHKKLKPQDFIIFSFIRKFSKVSKCIKFEEDGDIYYMFHWSLIIQQLPLLDLNTRQSIKKRMDKLSESGLIVPHRHNKAKGKQYYKFTQLADSLEFFTEDDIETTNVYSRDNERLRERDNERLQDNNYNSNNNYNKKEREKPSQNLEVKESLSTLDPTKNKKGIPSPNYPASFTQELITACEAYFEHRKQIGQPFSSKNAKQTKVLQTSAQVAEYGETKVIASFYEAITEGWKMNYVRKEDPKNKSKRKQPKQAKKREVDGVLMSKLDGLKSRGIITYDRMNEILSWDSDEEISKEVDKLMKKPQQL